MQKFPLANTPDLPYHLERMERLIDMFYNLNEEFHMDSETPVSLEIVVNFAKTVFEELKRRGIINANC